MKTYLVIYYTTPIAFSRMAHASPEEQENEMALWFAWKDSLGDHLIDFGAPIHSGARVLPNGSAEMSYRDVSGYSIIRAQNMDEAKQLLLYHPQFSYGEGCDVELYECLST